MGICFTVVMNIGVWRPGFTLILPQPGLELSGGWGFNPFLVPSTPQVFFDPHWFSQKYIIATPSGFTTNSRRKRDVTRDKLSRDFRYLNVNIGCSLMSK